MAASSAAPPRINFRSARRSATSCRTAGSASGRYFPSTSRICAFCSAVTPSRTSILPEYIPGNPPPCRAPCANATAEARTSAANPASTPNANFTPFPFISFPPGSNSAVFRPSLCIGVPGGGKVTGSAGSTGPALPCCRNDPLSRRIVSQLPDHFLAVPQLPEIEHAFRGMAGLALQGVVLRGDLVVHGENHRFPDPFPVAAVFLLPVLRTLPGRGAGVAGYGVDSGLYHHGFPRRGVRDHRVVRPFPRKDFRFRIGDGTRGFGGHLHETVPPHVLGANVPGKLVR